MFLPAEERAKRTNKLYINAT